MREERCSRSPHVIGQDRKLSAEAECLGIEGGCLVDGDATTLLGRQLLRDAAAVQHLAGRSK